MGKNLKIFFWLFGMMVWFWAGSGFSELENSGNLLRLAQGWQVQSSIQVKESGEVISRLDYEAKGWYSAKVPGTVLAVLVENQVYPEPNFGINLQKIPGSWFYPLDVSIMRMPLFSPFRKPWWYRKEFLIPGEWAGKRIWLNFKGINFRAELWLNGKKLADKTQFAGTFRRFQFEITDWAKPGKRNALAVKIYPPKHRDLSFTWVDWNPSPPDRNTGIWQEVYLKATGPVVISSVQVIPKLALDTLNQAELSIYLELANLSPRQIKGELKGEIEKINFSLPVSLKPGEKKEVVILPEDFPQLKIKNPRLWWPYQLGTPELYQLRLAFKINRSISDQSWVRFGIREISSELTPEGYRLFKINGKPILIKGAGWAPDLMLRYDPARLRAQIQYVKNLNLNTIRLEGKLESDLFYQLCDEEGILVIAGWCCCHHWERWSKWDEEDYQIAEASLRDQLKRLRNHPCLLSFWYGSDNPPPPRVEEIYLRVFKECRWQNPYQSSATAKPTEFMGATGLKMTGPYEYVPPVYWYQDKKRGGAWGFNTETSPGPAPPLIDSLKQFLPREKLWPVNFYWNYHCGRGMFANLRVFNQALSKRYGAPKDLKDYERKAQATSYEAERAMFEAYRRNKYHSTGVIQWMLNDAWTSMIWHLYDYYLRPVGGFYGTQKACEPVHIFYAYDDHSVYLANASSKEFKNLRAQAGIYDFGLCRKFFQEKLIDLPADGVKRVLVLPEPEGISSTYFLRLWLRDDSGRILSENFYWLSTKKDELNWAFSQWHYTPIKSYADFTLLETLPLLKLEAELKFKKFTEQGWVRVKLKNPSSNLGFLVRLRLVNKTGQEILPVFWQENYVSIFPEEERVISGWFWLKDLKEQAPRLLVEGWNIKPLLIPAETD